MENLLGNMSGNASQLPAIDKLMIPERTGIKFSMALFQFLTLGILVLYAVAIYKKIDTSHLVFATIFQEILALIALLFACLMAYLPMMAVAYRTWLIIFQGTGMVAILVHQVSWLVITCLSVEYSRTYVDEKGSGSINKLPVSDRILFVFGNLVVCNLPDFVSIIAYVMFLLKIKIHKNNQVEPEIELNNQDSLSSVSTVEGDYDFGHPNQLNAAQFQQLQMQQHPQADDQDNQLDMVHTALLTHVLSALVDLVILAMMPLVPGVALNHFVGLHVTVAVVYWVPMVVVWRNFKKMGEMVKFYFDLVC